jgi:hypothetical protein
MMMCATGQNGKKNKTKTITTKPVFEVVRRYCKRGWSHKVATITELCTVYEKEGVRCYRKVYF